MDLNTITLLIYFYLISLVVLLNTFVKHIYTNTFKVNKLQDKVKKSRFEDKFDYESQLKYISHKQDIERENFNLFYYKAGFLITLILVSINIRKFPLYIFGIKVGFFVSIAIIISIAMIQTFILKKLGVILK